jgi:cytochrome c peroxidase
VRSAESRHCGSPARAEIQVLWHGMSIVCQLFFCLYFLLFPVLVRAQSSPIQDAVEPQFIPPTPGTYLLPTIDTVTDHLLLNTAGGKVHLHALTQGKVAVLSFMYTSCADVGGCPLAAAVLQQIDRRLSERPELAKRVTLLSVSFDPERDTPPHLAKTRDILNPHTDWHFLTTSSQTDLNSILADFNQPVVKLSQENGDWNGLFRHVLKVYLLDANHNVRNIYSTGLFNAQLVINDIETILLETDKQAATIRQQ